MHHTSDSVSLSVWEVLGREHFELTGTQPDPEYTQAHDAFVKARADLLATPNPPEHLRQAHRAAERNFQNVLFSLLHDANRSALCFSGGGIRSATFGLGILQGLARYSWQPGSGATDEPPKLLAEFDYLSTVSGGGYLGGWLTSWIHRQAGDTGKVIREIAARPAEKFEPEPRPIRHLRAYSNYLNPRLGAFSADTWTLAATIIRNMLLNWVLLLPLMAAALVLPHLVTALLKVDVTPSVLELSRNLAFVLGALAAAYLVYDLPSAGSAGRSQSRFLLLFMAPSLLAAFLVVLHFGWLVRLAQPYYPARTISTFVVAMLALGLLLGAPLAIRIRKTARFKWIAGGVIVTAASGVAAGLLGESLQGPLAQAMRSDPRLYAALAFPAALGVITLSQWALAGFASRLTDDEDREWWARCSAWWLIATVGWAFFCGVVLFAPEGLLAAKAGLAALFGAIAGYFGFSGKTKAGRREDEAERELPSPDLFGKLMEYGVKLIVPLFLVLLIMALTAANLALHARLEASGDVTGWIILLTGIVALAMLAGFIIDANKFSLHGMYRARLIRAFLGASNEKRAENVFTGFDPDDNIRMSNLQVRKPLHVVNMALNLVGGRNLAWQQRKAASFTATRLHAGSCRLGYQDSGAYINGQLTLGGTVTVSGAAASPNMGYHSSPLMTLIMTLFNARLGAWLPNPGPAGSKHWRKASPVSSVRTFVTEMFGLTTEDNPWVYVSDGGHFENLGIYEMVLRRCRVIIVSDGSADSEYTFEDLGNAVRKVRVDFGIPIEFSENLRITREAARTSRHCAIARIRYSRVDAGAPDGVLIYLKASLNGNEPPDVAHYAAENPSFPHQSTADQWFNEAQFESYRRLGQHVIEEIFDFERKTASLDEFISHVRLHLNR